MLVLQGSLHLQIQRASARPASISDIGLAGSQAIPASLRTHGLPNHSLKPMPLRGTA